MNEGYMKVDISKLWIELSSTNFFIVKFINLF